MKNDSVAEGPMPEEPCKGSRRAFLGNLCYGLGGLAVVAFGVPVGAFMMAPLLEGTVNKWRAVGPVANFQVGETVEVAFEDATSLPWSGVSAKTAAWLRREGEDTFTAFSVNCTHLGCPVRWLPSADLFMCPCHGGVYYQDGRVAAGPPPKPLPRYPVRVENGTVEILASAIPISTD